MRIVGLSLQRYGHLSDEVLAFPRDRGLHIVLGANEAGKSTALEAIADCLFGFGHSVHRAFLHQPDTLRIGITLQAADGREETFVRRKRRAGSLTDRGGEVVPEAALAPFLNGMTRPRFETMFGLDAQRLRHGGASIVTQHGDAGSVLLDAQTGVRGLRDLVGKLDDEAKALFGRKGRSIESSVAVVIEHRATLAERSLSGTAYQDAKVAVEALDSELEVTRRELRSLRTEAAKLERVRRTAAPRTVRSAALRQLDALGTRLPLPKDGATRRTQALASVSQAGRDLARNREQDEVLRNTLAALPLDLPVLEVADEITAVNEARSHIAGITGDRAVQAARVVAAWEDIDRAGAELGIAERGEGLRAKLPGTLARQSAEHLASLHNGLMGREREAGKTLAAALLDIEEAQATLILNPVPLSDVKLREAADAARAEGQLETTLAEAATTADEAAHAARLALAALPIWKADAAALAGAPVPLAVEVQRLGTRLVSAQHELAEAETDAAAIDVAQTQTRAALLGLVAVGPVPTAQALAAIRSRRDLTWRLLRRQHIDAGPPATPEERAELATEKALPDVLDRLLPEADAMADQRHSDTRRTTEWERLTETEAVDAARHTAASRRCDGAVKAVENARSAWQTLWKPTGIDPLPPAAMTEWSQRRDVALAAERKAVTTLNKRDRLQDQRDALLAALRSTLPDTPPATLAATVREADRRLKVFASKADAHRTAANAVRMAEMTRARAVKAKADVDRELADWQPGWTSAMLDLGLSETTLPGIVSHLLAHWTEVARHVQTLDEARRRVEEMDVVLRSRSAALTHLAERLGERVIEEGVAGLYARLFAAKAAETERHRIEMERSRLATGRSASERTRVEAEDHLLALREIVDAVNDEALVRAIERAELQDTLTATLAKAEQDLAVDTNGMTPAELEQEAAGLDLDAAQARVAEIEARVAALDAERVAAAADRATRQAALTAMEHGADVFGPSQSIQTALAQIDDDAVRYMRLRMAHVLLRAGAERHRQEQQGPLLRRAGTLFASMTEGRYERLDLDEGPKGEPLIAAVRPDGTQCAIEFLSEGTRDQLYLSLRLAAVAAEVGASTATPFIADDLLVNFDDRRAAAALGVLAEFGQTTQVILFTHHAHLATMADPSRASVHPLPAEIAR